MVQMHNREQKLTNRNLELGMWQVFENIGIWQVKWIFSNYDFHRIQEMGFIWGMIIRQLSCFLPVFILGTHLDGWVSTLNDDELGVTWIGISLNNLRECMVSPWPEDLKMAEIRNHARWDTVPPTSRSNEYSSRPTSILVLRTTWGRNCRYMVSHPTWFSSFCFSFEGLGWFILKNTTVSHFIIQQTHMVSDWISILLRSEMILKENKILKLMNQ